MAHRERHRSREPLAPKQVALQGESGASVAFPACSRDNRPRSLTAPGAAEAPYGSWTTLPGAVRRTTAPGRATIVTAKVPCGESAVREHRLRLAYQVAGDLVGDHVVSRRDRRQPPVEDGGGARLQGAGSARCWRSALTYAPWPPFWQLYPHGPGGRSMIHTGREWLARPGMLQVLRERGHARALAGRGRVASRSCCRSRSTRSGSSSCPCSGRRSPGRVCWASRWMRGHLRGRHLAPGTCRSEHWRPAAAPLPHAARARRRHIADDRDRRQRLAQRVTRGASPR